MWRANRIFPPIVGRYHHRVAMLLLLLFSSLNDELDTESAAGVINH